MANSCPIAISCSIAWIGLFKSLKIENIGNKKKEIFLYFKSSTFFEGLSNLKRAISPNSFVSFRYLVIKKIL